jgi:hypothetical protein
VVTGIGRVRRLAKLLGIIVIGAVIAGGLAGCDNGSTDDNSGGGATLDGVWSQADNSAIRFTGNNLQSTNNVTATNVNWTLQGTYTYSSPTLTITPPPAAGVVQPAVQGTAVVNGIQLTITGFPGAVAVLNGSWTKQ